MHDWSDNNVDWKGIGDAAFWIGRMLRRYGRISVSQTKEKYGTARVYCHFGWHQVFCITHPGYMYSRYPKWLWSLDCRYGPYLTNLVNPLIIPVHKWWYRQVYKMAVHRWPHLAGEILSGADWIELLLGIDPRLKREWQGTYYAIRWADDKELDNKGGGNV